MDATGSMGSYIASATKNIEAICEHVGHPLSRCILETNANKRALKIIHSEKLSGRDALRLGLLAYRDHPPQDHTYIVKNCKYGPLFGPSYPKNLKMCSPSRIYDQSGRDERESQVPLRIGRR